MGAGGVGAGLQPGGVAGGVDALARRGVGEQGAAVAIAHGIDARGGLQAVVGGDPGPAGRGIGEGGPQFGQPRHGGRGEAADGHQRLLRPYDLAAGQGQFGPAVLGDQAFHLGAGPGVDAFAAHDLRHHLGHVRVLGRGQPRGGVDHGDPGSQAVVDFRDLEADGPGPDDDEAFRGFGEIEHRRDAEHGLSVGLDPREGGGPGAQGQDQRVEGDVLRVAADGHPGHAGRDAGQIAGDEAHPGLGQRLGHGRLGGGQEFFLFGLDGPQIGEDGPGGQLLAGLGGQGLHGQGGGQQMLGRDAAPVEAGAAELAALDERYGQTGGRAGLGRLIASGAGPDHDEASDAAGFTAARCVHTILPPPRAAPFRRDDPPARQGRR